MRVPTAVRLIAGALLLASVASACGGKANASGPDPSDHLTIPVPTTLGGLAVTAEDKATEKLKESVGKQTYVRDGSVFALRLDKELMGVLQVVRLTPDARPEDHEFRKKIACQIAGTCRAPERIGDILFFKGTVNQQLIHVWFVDRFMLAFILRQDDENALATIDYDAVLEDLFELRPVPA